LDVSGYFTGKISNKKIRLSRGKYKMSVNIASHMPGTIAEILVKVGDQVQADDELLILESMKMENPICAPSAGKVKEIKVKEKDKVDTNQVLIVLE
jgi:biotin carboxyl carrier protein